MHADGCHVRCKFAEDGEGTLGEDCQFSKRLVMDEGSGTGADVLPTQTPWVVYSMQRLRPRTRVGMATHLGWGRPNPPLIGGHAAYEERMGRQQASVGQVGDEVAVYPCH